jgi:hypothetical protein
MPRTVRSAGMELDHVLIGVADLAAAVLELEAHCGLASVEAAVFRLGHG